MCAQLGGILQTGLALTLLTKTRENRLRQSPDLAIRSMAR